MKRSLLWKTYVFWVDYCTEDLWVEKLVFDERSPFKPWLQNVMTGIKNKKSLEISMDLGGKDINFGFGGGGEEKY